MENRPWPIGAAFNHMFASVGTCITAELIILSPPPVVSFSGHQKRETTGGNETTGRGDSKYN